MTFLQATTGSGGWPLSIFLTPDLKPIFAGTYFPPVAKYGSISFTDLLESINKKWKLNETDLRMKGENIIGALRESIEEQNLNSKSQEEINEKPIELCYNQISKGYDSIFGGFTKAPKFPRPSVFDLLFRVISREGNSNKGKEALEMIKNTLKKMGMGGIYDHLGGGFHRYSVTKDWHIPQFFFFFYFF